MVQVIYCMFKQTITDLLSTLVYDPLQDGISPLYAAAQEGHLEMVRALLEGGADVNQARKVCTCVSRRAHKCVISNDSFVSRAV